MNKQNLLKTIDLCGYALLINAVVFAVIFQYASGLATLYVCLISFLLAFLALIIFCVLRFAFSKTEGLELSAGRKVWLGAKLVLNFLMLALVVLILIFW